MITSLTKRINYIDNLRWITVFLLIVYHTAMAYNTWGEANYIFFGSVRPIACIVTLISPWFMPLMFVLAGMSSYYSLDRRGYKTFIKERFTRLGIPLVFGILILSPVLSFIADVTHNGYEGNYLEHYKIFFTRVTDLSGYDGGFGLAHFWFILALIVISLIACLAIRFCPTSRINYLVLVLALLAVFGFDIRVAGKPIITYLCLYLLGYYQFSDPEFTAWLSRYRKILLPVFVISTIANTFLFMYTSGLGPLNNICNYISFASGVPALITVGREYLNDASPFTKFNAKISYVFYIIHFPLVVLCQYFLSRLNVGIVVNFFITILITYPLTYGLCFLISHTRFIRVLFGLKKSR